MREVRIVYYYQEGKFDEYNFVKDLAAFIVAYLTSEANVMFNGEVPYGNKRFDHVGYKIQLPISLLRPDIMPTIIIEDTTDKKRLKDRMMELKGLSLNEAYILVSHRNEENLIMSLHEVPFETNTKTFLLEVGSRCWTLRGSKSS